MMNSLFSVSNIPHRTHMPGSASSQKGVVLIVALIILMAMTIISVTSMTTSTLEERMSGNMNDREVAFQSAEAALRYGERLVEAGIDPALFDTNCTDGLCDHDIQAAGTYPEYWTDTTLDVWDTATRHRSYTGSIADVKQPAKIIIEFMGQRVKNLSGPPQPGDPLIYRITALGTGKTNFSRVMLQSTYVKE